MTLRIRYGGGDEENAQSSGWRQGGYDGQGSRGGGRRDDRGDRFHWEPPTEEVRLAVAVRRGGLGLRMPCARVQMLARIPEAGPWTAFVGLHPGVAHDVKESELHDIFHDAEKRRVERVRIVLHRDTGAVKIVFVDFEDAESLRNALHLEASFRDRPVKVEVAESREPKRAGGGDRPKAGFHGQGRRDHGGMQATAYDVDTEDADWMARRVQEKLDLEEAGKEAGKEEGGGGKADGGEKKAEGAGKSGEGAVKANPFGNAKPRDETEYERKLEEQRKARAEEKRKEAEEKRRKEAEERREKEGRGPEAGKGRDGGGDWRSEAKPLEARQRKVETVRVVRAVGKERGSEGGGEHRQGGPGGPGGGGEHRQGGPGGGEHRQGGPGGGNQRREWGGGGGQQHGRDGKPGRDGEGGGGGGGEGDGVKQRSDSGADAGKKRDAGRGEKDAAAARVETKKEAAAAAPAARAEKKAAANMFDLLGEEED